MIKCLNRRVNTELLVYTMNKVKGIVIFMMSFKEVIKKCVFSKADIDMFLDEKRSTWARFDPELGYIVSNSSPHNGVEGSFTISTVQKNEARTQYNYENNPCRINTYGNSFTECHQVSDGETWQEYLAAHICEPVRNFGVAGFGVYQAYRRMLRTEESDLGAEYIILYIWGDDHARSLLRARRFHNPGWIHNRGFMFHGNCWAHMEMNLDTGKLVEIENLFDTPDKLYKIADPDYMYEVLKDDLMLQLRLFFLKEISEIDFDKIKKLADILNISFSKNESNMYDKIVEIGNKYSFSATKKILDKTVEYVNKNNKKILIALLDPDVTKSLIMTGERYDQEVVDYIKKNKIKLFDMNLVHAEDFKCYSFSYDDYINKYFIDHYNPAGNHMFAFALKNHIVDLLDPKPITYRNSDKEAINFDYYLNSK